MKQIFEQYGEAIIAFIACVVIMGIIVTLLIDGGFLANAIEEISNGAV